LSITGRQVGPPGGSMPENPRTVASALRAVGLGAAPGFCGYHRVLSRRRWSGGAVREQSSTDGTVALQ